MHLFVVKFEFIVSEKMSKSKRCDALEKGSWDCFLDAYEIGPVIGTGSFSVVCKVSKRSTGFEYAGKFTVLHEADKEMSATRKLQNCQSESPLLLYHDVVEDDTGCYMCLVSDLMKGRDLQNALDDRGSYSEEDARVIMCQILEALKCMHESGLVHRDLKLENVLLPNDENHTRIKIADFGLTASWASGASMLRQRCGTPVFVAPEVIPEDCEYDNKVDVWSAGVILYILLSGFPPFWGDNLPQMLASIMTEEPKFTDPVWELVSPAGQDLIRGMMAKDPSSRPSVQEALAHPWMLDL